MSLDFHWQKINIEGVHHEEYIHVQRFWLALEVMVRGSNGGKRPFRSKHMIQSNVHVFGSDFDSRIAQQPIKFSPLKFTVQKEFSLSSQRQSIFNEPYLVYFDTFGIRSYLILTPDIIYILSHKSFTMFVIFSASSDRCDDSLVLGAP